MKHVLVRVDFAVHVMTKTVIKLSITSYILPLTTLFKLKHTNFNFYCIVKKKEIVNLYGSNAKVGVFHAENDSVTWVMGLGR